MNRYHQLWLILTEAEARRDDSKLPADVRERSAETVSICKEAMAREGLTRDALKTLATDCPTY